MFNTTFTLLDLFNFSRYNNICILYYRKLTFTNCSPWCRPFGGNKNVKIYIYNKNSSSLILIFACDIPVKIGPVNARISGINNQKDKQKIYNGFFSRCQIKAILTWSVCNYGISFITFMLAFLGCLLYYILCVALIRQSRIVMHRVIMSQCKSMVFVIEKMLMMDKKRKIVKTLSLF